MSVSVNFNVKNNFKRKTMKTTKISSIFLLLFFASAFLFSAFAQKRNGNCNAYFPTTPGTVLEYAFRDVKNGSNRGTIRQTVTNVTDTGNGLKIIAKSERTDQNVRVGQEGTYSTSGEITMRCENGVFYADVRTLLDNQIGIYKGGDAELSGTELQLPGKLSPGQSLPDADISIGAGRVGLPIPPITIEVVNRQVKAVESITTPAGTFNCYKIMCEVEMHPVVTSYTRLVQWIAEGVGTVKSEMYDEAGKLMSETILTGLKE